MPNLQVTFFDGYVYTLFLKSILDVRFSDVTPPTEDLKTSPADKEKTHKIRIWHRGLWRQVSTVSWQAGDPGSD